MIPGLSIIGPILTSVVAKVPMKIQIIVLAGLALMTILFLGYRHYSGLLDEVSTLRENEAKYDMTVQLQDETIGQLKGVADEWKQHTESIVSEFAKLQQIAEEANAETRRLHELFSKHDLTRLARAKPGLIERRVNDGTADIIRMFECQTTPGGCSPVDGRAGTGVPAAAPSP